MESARLPQDIEEVFISFRLGETSSEILIDTVLPRRLELEEKWQINDGFGYLKHSANHNRDELLTSVYNMIAPHVRKHIYEQRQIDFLKKQSFEIHPFHEFCSHGWWLSGGRSIEYKGTGNEVHRIVLEDETPYTQGDTLIPGGLFYKGHLIPVRSSLESQLLSIMESIIPHTTDDIVQGMVDFIRSDEYVILSDNVGRPLDHGI